MKNDEDTGFATCVGVKRDMDDACASAISSSSVSLVNQLVIMVCSLILFSAQHWMLPTSTNLSGLAQSGSFLHTPCGQECRCPTSVTLGAAEEDVLLFEMCLSVCFSYAPRVAHIFGTQVYIYI